MPARRKQSAPPRPPGFINWAVVVQLFIGYTAAGFAALSLNIDTGAIRTKNAEPVILVETISDRPATPIERIVPADHDTIEIRLIQRPVETVAAEKAVEPLTSELPESVAAVQGNSSGNTGKRSAKKVETTKIERQENMLEAVDAGDVGRVLNLVEQGSGVDSLLESGETALMRAAWNGDSKMVSTLLDAGAQIDFYSARGQSALLYATIRGQYAVAERLIDRGAGMNRATPDGKTPLMAAAWNNHNRVVELLINKGAKINRADKSNRTALYYAVSVGNVDAVSMLVAAGADKNRTDVAGVSINKLAQDKNVDLGAL